MPLDEAFAYYGTSRGERPGYVNSFAVQSRAYTIPFDVLGAAPSIKVPTMIVHSDNALAPSLVRSFIAALPRPPRVLWLESTGQIDFYDNPRLIEAATEGIASFFDNVSHRATIDR